MNIGIVSIDLEDKKEDYIYTEGVAFVQDGNQYEEFCFSSKLSKTNSYIDTYFYESDELQLVNKELLESEDTQRKLMNRLYKKVTQ